MANPNPNWNRPPGNFGSPRPDVGPNPWGVGSGAPVPDPRAQGDWYPAQEVGPYRGQGQDGSHAFMTKVFGWMTMGLGITAAVAWVTFSTGLYVSLMPYMWMILIAQVGIVLALSFGMKRLFSPGAATAAFLVYSATMGLTLTTIFVAYTMASIASVFLVTTLTFGFMFVYGWTTKKDLTSWGSLLFMGLIGLIIAHVVNMFVGGELMGFAISAIGVLIFVGLTAYDAQKIKQMGAYGFADAGAEQKSAIMGALALYLDFINLFLYLLRLLGDRR
jgi:FtsH-binding integral membrane protein